VQYPSTLASGQTIVNTASISSSDITDPNTSNNTSSTTITVKTTSSSPSINTPIVAGDTTVSGTSIGTNGTTINVYNSSTLIGTTTVSGGAWSANVVTVSGGDSIRAKAIFPGGSESDYSSSVTVLYKSSVPVITVPIYAGATVIRGITSEADGTSIEVYLDNVLLGTTTANSGSWSLTVSASSLISSHLIKARAVAPGKYQSNFSAEVTIIDAISPVPAITTPVIAGAALIEGSSLGPDGTYIQIIKNRGGVLTTVGYSIVSSNNWFISGLDSLEVRAGDIFTAKARIDTNNDGVNNSSDNYSDSSSEVTASLRNSEIPSINFANSGETLISGSSNGNDLTLIKLYKNSSLYSSVPVSNFLWSVATPSLTFGDQYKATATFDNNNDGVINGSDIASGYSSIMTVGGTPPTNAPVVTQPITAGDTTVYGTSDEANGTSIEVFVNGSSIGTTFVSELHWEIIVPLNTLQTGETVTAKATASGKTQSAASTGVVVENKISPTPSVNANKAGDTIISGSVIAQNGSIIEVLVNTVQVGTAIVSSNSWSLTIPSSTLQTGESVRARTHIDYNNDEAIELDDESSSLSTEVIVINRISPVPVLDPIGFNSGSITGSLSPVAVTKIYVYRLRSGTRTLLGVTQTNSPTFFLDEIISNPWILGDSITATSITDTNNDGVVDDNDIQSIDSAPEIIFDDSGLVFDSENLNSFCRKDTPSGSPLIYNIESYGKNGLKVYFNPNIQPKDRFEYQYINQQSTFERKGLIKDYNSGFFILENLVSFAPHKVRIRAINGCKAGSWSEYKNATPGITLSTSVPTASNTNEMFPKPFFKNSFKETYRDETLEIGKNKINETLPKTELKKVEGSSNVIYYISGILLIGSAGIIFYFKKIQK